MRKINKLRSDTGIIILHWGVAALLVISLLTGLRIGADEESHVWLRYLSSFLPDGDVWPFHIWSGLGVASLAIAYTLYVRRTGLGRHVALNRSHIASLGRPGKIRWVALHIVMSWLLYIVLAVQLVTGLALYLGQGGNVVTLHYVAALALLAYPLLHVACHAAIGGLHQLLRIFRPASLAQTQAQQNFTSLLIDEYLKQEAKLEAIRVKANGPIVPAQRDAAPGQQAALYLHPAVVAGGLALTVAIAALPLDRFSEDRLRITRATLAELPKIDGDLSDPIWQKASPVRVATMQGANLGGSGTSNVDIRAVHDGKYVYFAFTLDDPTRSLKHLPLIKKADGWHLLHEQYDIEDEDNYYEDKFGVMFSHSLEPAGGSAHLGAKPLSALPAAYSERGLHYTIDGEIVDVWHWKASRGGLLGIVDDNYFGAPAKPKPEELAGKKRYKAGYATDPGKEYYKNNFKHQAAGGYAGPLKPERLPKDIAVTAAAMGRIDINPNMGEDERAKWWMTEAESAPYSPELDSAIPVGQVIPGVIVGTNYEGDRADVMGAARWAAGRWTLEAMRLIDTGNKFDLPIESGMALWVSPFDHSQTRHTRHMRPVIMELGQ